MNTVSTDRKIPIHAETSEKLSLELRKLLEKYEPIYCDNMELLRPARVEPVTIRLKPGAQPVKSTLFKESLKANQIIRRAMKALIDNGCVKPGQSSPWRCNTFLVSKKLALKMWTLRN